jgi:hypothetical protein
MASRWPEHPDDPVDPAFEPLIEAGEGESEGFELAEGELVEHAAHGDEHSTQPILRDAPDLDEELSDSEYGEADEEEEPW